MTQINNNSNSNIPKNKVEVYDKFIVDYRSAFGVNDAVVNVSTGSEDISFQLNRDGNLFVSTSFRERYLSEDDKNRMSKIANFMLKHPKKSVKEFHDTKLVSGIGN